jgi:Transposase DDE domain
MGIVEAELEDLFEHDLHAKRIDSLAGATIGALTKGRLGVHAIGIGLAEARGLRQKHTIKQVDRLLSNAGIEVWELFDTWVPYVLAERKEALVALDWTDFDDDDQSTLALHLVSSHGRATPLVWRTVRKSELKGERTRHEDEVLARFFEVAPSEIKITVLADRGFADRKLFALLENWGADYIIRMRGNTTVESAEGDCCRAEEWTSPQGKARILRGARITNARALVPAVVCVRAAKMRETWCLATSRADLNSTEVIKLYGRRFTIEEAFRDVKDDRFGFGFSQARVNSPARRDRLLFVAALAIALLTLLGAAGESLGYERHLKANTSKKRTYSLLRQGILYYNQIPAMPDDRLAPLMNQFAELLAQHALSRKVLGIL